MSLLISISKIAGVKRRRQTACSLLRLAPDDAKHALRLAPRRDVWSKTLRATTSNAR